MPAKQTQNGDGFGLDILWPSPGTSDEDAIVDIVFVHGLKGRRRGTFTKNNVLWPRDLLAKDFPQSRIMTWGYDADVMRFFGPVGQSSIHNHAGNLNLRLVQKRLRPYQMRRPIIFFAHSLGGLVVKDALFQSYLEGNGANRRLAAIKMSTVAVLFAGTPHRGSNAAKWATLAPRLAWFLAKDESHKLLNALRRGSDILEILQSQFRYVVDSFAVYTLTEEMSYPKIGKIVEKDSAVIGCRHEVQIDLHANHSQMVKFASRTEDNYQIVKGCIEEIIEDKVKELLVEKDPQGTARSYRRDSQAFSSFGLASRTTSSVERSSERPLSQEFSLRFTESSWSSSDQCAHLIEEGRYYLEQQDRNNPATLNAADAKFMRACCVLESSRNPEPSAMVQALGEIVNVRLELSYNKGLNPTEKKGHLQTARFFGERALYYARRSLTPGDEALVELQQVYVSAREAEIAHRLGAPPQEVRRLKTEAIEWMAIFLEELQKSGYPNIDRQRAWVARWRVRLQN